MYLNKEVEIILRGAEFFSIKGIIRAVGEDYIAIEQPENNAFVYPEEIAILNVRRGYNDEKRKDVS